MAFSEKQKTFFKKNYFEVGTIKSEVKYIRSTNKDFTQVYPTLRAAWLANKQYSQISTGRNHEERGVVVVDDDTRNIDEALRNFRLLKFPIPNIIIENPDSHHTQSFYFLKEPVMIKNYSTIREKSIEKNTSNYKKYKEVNDMMNFLAGDPNFTCWRCKNPFNDKFETIECRLEEYTLNELYNEVKDTYEVSKLLNKKEDNKKSKSRDNIILNNKRYSLNEESSEYAMTSIDGIEFEYKKNASGRNELIRSACTSILYRNRNWSEDTLVNYLLKNNYELSQLAFKPSLPESEIRSIAKSSYSYFLQKKGSCIYSKEQIDNSKRIRNIMKLIRINKIRKDISTNIILNNKRAFTNMELCEKYNLSVSQLKRDRKLLKTKEELLPMVIEALEFINKAKISHITNNNVKYIISEENEIYELYDNIKVEL